MSENQYFSMGNLDCKKEIIGNQYKKVLLTEHTWYTSWSTGWAQGTFHNRHKISFDSVFINEKYYYRVLNSADSIGNEWTRSSKYVRESDGRLWLLDSLKSTVEVLIMDMNFNKNDIFEYTDFFGQSKTFIVTSTDSILDLSGQLRKVITLSCAENEAILYRWIEGIGPDIGVFESRFDQCIIDGNPNTLTCFYSDDQQIWQGDSFSQCWTNGLNDKKLQLLSFSPNPGYNQINITLPENVILPLRYKVMSVSGQQLQIGYHNTSDNMRIESSHLPAGIYVISLMDMSGKIWQGKLVKG